MLRSSRGKSSAFVLAVVAALFSAALVVARQTQESRPTDAGARERAAALRSTNSLRASLRDSDKGVREQARWALGVVDDKGKDH
jgi:hypothetical protein